MKYHHKIWCLLAAHLSIFLYAACSEWSWYWFFASYFVGLLFHWIGNECGLHRLWAHRSYQTTKAKELAIHAFSIPLLYGTPLTYACAHRHHHKHSDTEKDSHVLSPWWHVTLYIPNKKHPVDQSLCLDLIRDPAHLFVHKYYFVINWALLFAFLLAFGLQGTGWSLSAIVAQNFVLGGLINVLGHTKHPFSSRAHDTKDDSLNSLVLQALTLNQGLHNNHHQKPSSWTFACNSGELDVPGWLIKHFFKA